MKNNTKNILFLFLSSVSFGSALGIYLPNISRKQDEVFFALIITSGILLLGSFAILGRDVYTKSEEKFDSESNKKVLQERERSGFLSREKLVDNAKIGRNLMHTHYSFENFRNIWRSLYLIITHTFILIVLSILFNVNAKSTEYILALTIGVLSFAIHILFLFNNLRLQYYHKEYRTSVEMVKKKETSS
jgi:hypothetical protein